MNKPNVIISPEKIEVFCQRYHIKKLSLFGSVLRDDFRPDSDIDVLVEFEAGHVPKFDFFTIEENLTELIGRPVELHTAGFLSPYFRDEIHEIAEVHYARS
ncbi:MAG: nucleotidyltransferase family protein [Chloroflexi bacterium]|nr:nucleotidyltransferase family protein [Chloroflexota bacterium]